MGSSSNRTIQPTPRPHRLPRAFGAILQNQDNRRSWRDALHAGRRSGVVELRTDIFANGRYIWGRSGYFLRYPSWFGICQIARLPARRRRCCTILLYDLGIYMALVINERYGTAEIPGWRADFYLSRLFRLFPVYLIMLAVMVAWFRWSDNPHRLPQSSKCLAHRTHRLSRDEPFHRRAGFFSAHCQLNQTEANSNPFVMPWYRMHRMDSLRTNRC